MISEREMEPYLRLLMPLAELPNDALVTKRNGEKAYKLSREVRFFYSEKGKLPQKIKPDAGVVFLIPARGSDDISVIADTTVVEWHVSEEELLAWLHNREDEREAK